MGVKGLKTYIENRNMRFLRNCPLRESRLIIDGCNLYYNLYFSCKLDQVHGGDYDAFEDLLIQFFNNLKACDISPYVVLDGGADHTDKKFDTLKQRHEEKLKSAQALSRGLRGTVLPILIKDVFRQVLHKLKIPLVQCIEEADWEIAALANQWNCPVLSDDSDFYIFNLTGGVLPIAFFRWRTITMDRRTNKKVILAKRFNVENLCAVFKNMNVDLLPVLATILGNDYVKLQNISHLWQEWEEYSVCGHEYARIDGLLNWLCQFPGPEAAIQNFLEFFSGSKEKEIVRKALFKGIKEYKLINGYLAQFFHSKSIPQTVPTGRQRALPEWTLKLLLEGRMASSIIDVLFLQRVILTFQVEDFQFPSCSETSLPIRQVIYGLLLLGKDQTEDKYMAAAIASTGTSKCFVEEYDREGSTITSLKIEAIETRVKEGLQLETLSKEPHNVRLQVLLDALGVPLSTIRAIPSHLQLQVFVTRYWLVNARPQLSLVHLWGLLLGMVYGHLCSKPDIQRDTLLKFKKLQICHGRIRLDHETAHLYSQWQSCLKWSLCLNRLLCLPLPEPECARLYCGTLVHQAVRELKRGITPESLLVRGSYADRQFIQLRDAVLSLVEDDIIKKMSTRHKNRAAGRTQNDYRGQKQSDELSSWFEQLMHDDVEDCDDNDEPDGKGRKAKGHKMETLECSYNVRTRHKAKERNAKHPSKKFERRCFE